MSRRWPESLRWGACFAFALGFHAAGAAALLARWNDTSAPGTMTPVIMIDLAPVAAAPETTPTDTPPDQVLSRTEEPEPEPEPEKPIEKVEIPPDPAPEPELTVPPPKPIEKPPEVKKQKRKAIARTPSAADRKANHAAAPLPGASARNPDAILGWHSRIKAQLERNKRYPSEAQSRGEGGVVQLAFSIDRNGGVHHARIVRSSGSSLLDRETLSLVERAAPLPAPPPEVAGSQIAVVVPIRYNIR